MPELKVPQKLSKSVLRYQIIPMSVVLSICLIVLVGMQFMPIPNPNLNLIVIAFLLVASGFWALYTYLGWKMFEYTLSSDGIFVKSGIIFRTEKNINFNDLQTVSTEYGPLKIFFGVKALVGFTASPEQVVVNNKGIERAPDLNILLDSQAADEIISLCKKGDIQKVQTVQQV